MKELKEIFLKINEKLNVPQPVKSRILLEISTDMADLYEHYVSQGDIPSQAIKKVEERFELDDENLKELISLHQTPLKKLIDTFNLGKNASLKTIMLYILIAVIVGFCIYSIQTTPFFSQSSKYVYPVGLIGFLTLCIILGKFIQLYLIKDHTIKSLRKGMSVIILGISLAFLTGIIGFSRELYLTLHRVFVPLHDCIFKIAPENNFDPSVYREIVQWGLRISSLMMVTIGVTLVLIILWLLVIRKIKTIEMFEAQNLIT